MKPRMKYLAAVLAVSFSLPAAADDLTELKAELKRLSERLATMEQHNRELEKSLASERVSESEPEIVTRLKAVEYQTLSMQKQARQVETLEGISVSASLTGVVQKANTGDQGALANYRGDVAIALPGGEIGNTEGNIFTQLRFGQGDGVALGNTYTSTPNTTAFQLAGGPADDSTVILAQAWYQLNVPLLGDDSKANAREHVHLTFGKIDPFVFFDQNSIADDESAGFMNNAFVHNPLLDSGGDAGVDTYGFTPGVIAQYANEREKGSEWGASIGVFGSGSAANFGGSLAKPFVIAQAETAARINYLPGNYRAYLWTNGRGADYDGNEQRHTGIGFSLDQKVDDDLTLFGRYGHQATGKVKFDRALTAGVALSGNRWGRGADALGMAFGGLRTSADFRNDSLAVDSYQADGWEKQAEFYYRYQVNGNFELTPDFQIISRPGGDSSVSAVKLLALRARLGF
ncbi:MAG: transporter [Gallionellales bacterium GWA2_60_18]|nr:MAG: transporter [Gallionellales bacterium GWA2_60_18]